MHQAENHDLFAAAGADVVVEARYANPGDLLDHRLDHRPGRFDQLGPDLFEQVPALFGRKRLDEVLFGRGQYTLEADHEQVTDQMGLNVLGAPAHEFLLKATDSLGNGGFDFALRLHGGPRIWVSGGPATRGPDLETRFLVCLTL